MQIMRPQKDFEKKNYENTTIYILKAIHYCYFMYWGTFEICVLKYIGFILPKKFSAPELA